MGGDGAHSSDEKAAFEMLYTAHHRAVLAYCARRTSQSDAWDAASEVFVVAWRRLDTVPPVDEARPWLLGVAYRVLANQRRSRRRNLRLIQKATTDTYAEPPLPDRQLIRNEEEREVIEALTRLRPKDREILQARLWEELSPAEVAEILGISRAAVDQRYSRAKKRLAGALEGRTMFAGRATRTTREEGGAT